MPSHGFIGGKAPGALFSFVSDFTLEFLLLVPRNSVFILRKEMKLFFFSPLSSAWLDLA